MLISLTSILFLSKDESCTAAVLKNHLSTEDWADTRQNNKTPQLKLLHWVTAWALHWCIFIGCQDKFLYGGTFNYLLFYEKESLLWSRNHFNANELMENKILQNPGLKIKQMYKTADQICWKVFSPAAQSSLLPVYACWLMVLQSGVLIAD